MMRVQPIIEAKTAPVLCKRKRNVEIRATGSSPVVNLADAAHGATFLGKGPMPRLGLGLAALGRPGYINLGHGDDLSSGKSVEDLRNNCCAVLDAAWEAGIRYFDAARSYGRAEEFLAGWLAARGVRPGDVAVGSKWGYRYTAGWATDTGGLPHEVKEHTRSHLASQSQESRQLLGSYLGLYQIHSATLDSGVLDADDVIDELASLKRDLGWRIGLSLSGERQAETLRRAMGVASPLDGSPLFDCVQATWNLLEVSCGDALLEAHEHGMSVIVKEALANGRLTPRNGAEAFAGKLRVLEGMARELDTTVDALALAAAMAQPFAPMVLSGAATPQQLASNFAAAALSAWLPEGALLELRGALAQDPAEYWRERGGLTWN